MNVASIKQNFTKYRGTRIMYIIVFIILVYLCFLYIINVSFLGHSGILVFNLDQATNVYNPFHTKEVSFDRLISDTFADELTTRVKTLKDHWRQKNPVMYTLGIGAYVEQEYQKNVASSNAFMQQHFADLYKLILEFFQKRYPDCQVKYRPECGLPGFHIFKCNSLFSMPVASVHVDRQWQKIKPIPGESLDTDNTLSFTLTLELPELGGGLYLFKNIPKNCLIPRPIKHILADKEHIHYRKGYYVLHTGNTVHMIAPSKYNKKEIKYRITLQCHGIKDLNSNTWWIYW